MSIFFFLLLQKHICLWMTITHSGTWNITNNIHTRIKWKLESVCDTRHCWPVFKDMKMQIERACYSHGEGVQLRGSVERRKPWQRNSAFTGCLNPQKGCEAQTAAKPWSRGQLAHLPPQGILEPGQKLGILAPERTPASACSWRGDGISDETQYLCKG